MKEFWTYTLLRVALFLAALAVVGGVFALVTGRVNYVVVVLIAAIVSSALSWRLLAGPRARLADSVNARAARATARFEEHKSREDAD